MTNEQRFKIAALRGRGLGYSAIAKTVGISRESVKAYCRTHDLGGILANTSSQAVSAKVPKKGGKKAPPAEDLKDRCRNCGAPLFQREKMKTRIFCSAECRQAWWNSHPERVKQKALYSYVCPVCGKDFTAYGNDHRKYCSRSCYIAGRFHRR